MITTCTSQEMTVEHPTTGRHRRPCTGMPARVWALAAALLATALTALFVPRRADRKPHPFPAASEHKDVPGCGDLLAAPPGSPDRNTRPAGASDASARWGQAFTGPSDLTDTDPDRIAGALVRPYLDLVPRPRPAEPEDYPAAPPATDQGEFVELADRIRAYLALNPGVGEVS
ncbi:MULTISPECIES: hypothetical protein [Nocardiopsis]|uniref:Secreted protein n=1 Tax=Nocardiopsis changdeensis TaxID=2831969 RepID=A0ABX8BK23_9ACTN|nr:MULTISPECIES: hypothetical protein [Nocardiopsis]QUX20768.1 hypothetical protein KGD84_20045 [Nocardiopsis changdeensis]QYX36700.1 hypothetical protein K1J57_29500 [Nocardiopsis sp. MT53]